MTQNNLAIAKAFYTAFGAKHLEAMEKFLHPDVQLITPFAKLQGREAYLEAAKNFIIFFNDLTLRTSFSEGDQAMIVYDLECSPPIGKVPGAALMSFDEGLIIKNELFHDTNPWSNVMGDLSA